MWGLLFIGFIGGYCVGSFVVCVLLLSGVFGVRVDELELVGVVWGMKWCVLPGGCF